MGLIAPRLPDAASGLVEDGEVDVADIVIRQPRDGSLPFRTAAAPPAWSDRDGAACLHTHPGAPKVLHR